MQRKTPITRLFVAGSLTAAVAFLTLVPFNMGGCGVGNLDVMQLANGANKGVKAAGMNEKNEPAIGQAVSLALTNTYGVTSNEQLARYVVLVGQTVASRTPRADQPWVFGVLDTNEVNAFSGPGGYVWVTRGAIAQMQDESELAGVLGHEIGHVVKQHGLHAAQQAGLADAGLTAASGTQAGASFGDLSDKIVDIIVKTGFSQPQEFEADLESVKYTAAAGYDPDGLLHFLTRIREKQKSGNPNFFGTHPGMDERIQRIKSQISSAGTGGNGAVLKDRFDHYTGRTPQVGMAD
ncbi:MAG TPA: M48 family metalloprotease [Tepidisphaeraceae bacterium]|jgi:predicted Zn-dependent protease